MPWITLQSKVRTEEYPSLNLILSTILLLKWETQLGILVIVIYSPNILYSFIWITLGIESPARRTKTILHKRDKSFTPWCKRSPQNAPHLDPRTPVGFPSPRGARAPAAGNTTLQTYSLFQIFLSYLLFYLHSDDKVFEHELLSVWICEFMPLVSILLLHTGHLIIHFSRGGVCQSWQSMFFTISFLVW